ncbi:MAG: hypothetical protein RL354_2142, partial [Planctomycetota bacterium]
QHPHQRLTAQGGHLTHPQLHLLPVLPQWPQVQQCPFIFKRIPVPYKNIFDPTFSMKNIIIFLIMLYYHPFSHASHLHGGCRLYHRTSI